PGRHSHVHSCDPLYAAGHNRSVTPQHFIVRLSGLCDDCRYDRVRAGRRWPDGGQPRPAPFLRHEGRGGGGGGSRPCTPALSVTAIDIRSDGDYPGYHAHAPEATPASARPSIGASIPVTLT